MVEEEREPSSGRAPVRIAGTAPVVHSCTDVAFRYQVASSRQPGEVGIAHRVDLACRRRISETVGELVEDDHDDRRSGGRLGEVRLRRALEQRREAGETKRKRTRKSTGAAPRTDRSIRAGLARA